MEAMCSSETSVETQRTTRRYIPEYSTLHNDRCKNLKSYATNGVFWKFRMLKFHNIKCELRAYEIAF
jgi:hypothetical protein